MAIAWNPPVLESMPSPLDALLPRRRRLDPLTGLPIGDSSAMMPAIDRPGPDPVVTVDRPGAPQARPAALRTPNEPVSAAPEPPASLPVSPRLPSEELAALSTATDPRIGHLPLNVPTKPADLAALAPTADYEPKKAFVPPIRHSADVNSDERVSPLERAEYEVPKNQRMTWMGHRDPATGEDTRSRLGDLAKGALYGLANRNVGLLGGAVAGASGDLYKAARDQNVARLAGRYEEADEYGRKLSLEELEKRGKEAEIGLRGAQAANVGVDEEAQREAAALTRAQTQARWRYDAAVDAGTQLSPEDAVTLGIPDQAGRVPTKKMNPQILMDTRPGGSGDVVQVDVNPDASKTVATRVSSGQRFTPAPVPVAPPTPLELQVFAGRYKEGEGKRDYQNRFTENFRREIGPGNYVRGAPAGYTDPDHAREVLGELQSTQLEAEASARDADARIKAATHPSPADLKLKAEGEKKAATAKADRERIQGALDRAEKRTDAEWGAYTADLYVKQRPAQGAPGGQQARFVPPDTAESLTKAESDTRAELAAGRLTPSEAQSILVEINNRRKALGGQ